jgi:hypothetical protein
MSADFAAATERRVTAHRSDDARPAYDRADCKPGKSMIEVRRELERDDFESRGIAVASVWLIFYFIILVAAATTGWPLVATQLAMH